MNNEGRNRHLQVIKEFLGFINSDDNNPFILKGGTALSLCYGLNRFSEDIDLDARSEKEKSFFKKIDSFCSHSEFSYRIGKDTSTVQRAFINYGSSGNPLKIEVSYRRMYIPDGITVKKNDIQVYSINELTRLKSAAYLGRDKIRDMYDVSYICTHYYNELDQSAKDALHAAFEMKELDQFDYIVQTQEDPLIDTNVLEDMFLESFEVLGLLSPEENEIDNEDDDSDVDYDPID